MINRIDGVQLEGKAPKRFDQVRIVYSTSPSITHYVFYLEDKFISRIEMELYSDGEDKRIEFYDYMTSTVQDLIDAQGPW